MVKLSRSRISFRKGNIRLSAFVTSPSLDKKYEIWFETEASNRNLLSLGPEVFLPILLFMSMRFKEELIIEESISQDLLNSLYKVMKLTSSWPDTDSWSKLYPINIATSTTKAVSIRSVKKGKGAFFSLGLDSFYTLKKSEIRKSTRLTHLILVHGFDIALNDKKLFSVVLKNAKKVAKKTEKKLIVVKTNLKGFVQEAVRWDAGHGAALASVSYLLAKGLDVVAFNSEDANLSYAPYGTHPDLDRLWSTKTLKIYSSGSGLKRSEKTFFIRDYKLAQDHLRVCYENIGGAYNCSKCHKCLRTMLQLDSVGALENFKTMGRIPPYHLLNLLIEPKHRLFLWWDLLKNLPFPRLHARWLIFKMLLRSYKKMLLS